MKYLVLTAALSIALFSCNEAAEETTSEEVESTEVVTEEAPAIAGEVDPVCNMERDSNWDAYSVNGTDTTWFCSSHCKEVYDADPEKYNKG